MLLFLDPANRNIIAHRCSHSSITKQMLLTGLWSDRKFKFNRGLTTVRRTHYRNKKGQLSPSMLTRPAKEAHQVWVRRQLHAKLVFCI